MVVYIHATHTDYTRSILNDAKAREDGVVVYIHATHTDYTRGILMFSLHWNYSHSATMADYILI